MNTFEILPDTVFKESTQNKVELMHFLKKNFSVREKKVHVIRQLKSCGER
jgi:hypothetical protein